MIDERTLFLTLQLHDAHRNFSCYEEEMKEARKEVERCTAGLQKCLHDLRDARKLLAPHLADTMISI